jgi:Protein of unknown function, DUF417
VRRGTSAVASTQSRPAASGYSADMYEGKMKIRGQTGRRGDRNLCSAEAILLRYGLALSFLWIGAMKFTAYEAEGIRPLAENSPLMSWFVAALGIRPFWNLLGVIEIATGVLAALRPVFRRGYCDRQRNSDRYIPYDADLPLPLRR